MARESSLAKLPIGAKIGIVFALAAMIGAGYYFVFLEDISNLIQAAQIKEESLKGDLVTANQAQLAFQKDLAELHEREQRRAEIEKILPSKAEYPSFLSSLQGVANVSGIALTAWNPEPEKAHEFYAQVPMKLKLSGRFHQIAKFFYSIGQQERIINMENISITDPSVQGDEVALKVEVQAAAFRTLSDAESVDQAKRAPGSGK